MNALTHVLQHWKTSLGGTSLGAVAFHLMQSGCGTSSWKSWSVALAVAGLGLVAKDPGSNNPVAK